MKIILYINDVSHSSGELEGCRMDFEISRANALDGLIISHLGGKKIAVTAAVTVQLLESF
jgi:hypothetical protein